MNIWTITLNTAIDRMVDIHHTENTLSFPAGKGINVARSLSIMGHEVTALAFCGKPQDTFFHSIETDLLHIVTLPIAGDTRTNTTLYDSVKGCEEHERTVGYSLAEPDFQGLLKILLEKLSKDDVVVCSGSIPSGFRQDAYEEIIYLCRLRGAKVFLDCDGPALKCGVTASPFFVKPNLHELEQFVGSSLPSEEEQKEAVSSLALNNQIRLVLLSLGENGALLFDSASKEWTTSKALQPRDTYYSSVGCGDSMVAGFIDAFLSANLPKALIRSMAYATANLTQKGPGILNPEDVIKLEQDAVQ